MDRTRTDWDLDHRALDVGPSSARVAATLVGIAIAGLGAVIGLRLGSAVGLAPLALILVGVPQALAPRRLTVGFRGVRYGRRWIARSQILGAWRGTAGLHLALTDGRIARIPLRGDLECDAAVRAPGKPAALFEAVGARIVMGACRPIDAR